MGHFSKKFTLFIMLIGLFLLTGCNKLRFNTFNASDDYNKSVSITPTAQDKGMTSDNESEVSTDITDDEQNNQGKTDEISITPTLAAVQPIANVELPIYTVNSDTSELETVTALVPADSEITPRLIVDTVIESMADQSIIVGVESVSSENDAIIVSFYKDKTPGANLGASYEEAVLDAIAFSLIDNGYKNVIYRIEGEAYSSGHIEFGIDEIYLGD